MQPPLKSLHPNSSLSPAKMSVLRKWMNERILISLTPGGIQALKARPDGTILDGHHRIAILRERGVNVDVLPRHVITKQDAS